MDVDFAALNNALWYGNLALAVALLGRMLSERLAGAYPFLFSYFLADVTQQCFGILARNILHNNNAYFAIYVAGQSVKLILSIFIVLELYRRTLPPDSAVSRFGRSLAIWVVLGVACIATLQLWIAPPHPGGRTMVRLYQFLSVERTIDFGLVLLLLAVIAFLAWFPVQMPRNAAYNAACFTVYFTLRFAGLLGINSAGGSIPLITTLELGVSGLCLLVLIWALNRASEQELVTPGHSWNPPEMERLARQLDSINEALARSSR